MYGSQIYYIFVIIDNCFFMAVNGMIPECQLLVCRKMMAELSPSLESELLSLIEFLHKLDTL